MIYLTIRDITSFNRVLPKYYFSCVSVKQDKKGDQFYHYNEQRFKQEKSKD